LVSGEAGNPAVGPKKAPLTSVEKGGHFSKSQHTPGGDVYHTKKSARRKQAAPHLLECEAAGSMDKVGMLTEILAQDPRNAFARYGLAMEYAGQGDAATALTEFDRLLADHPDYTAGYFMAAQTLAKSGDQQRAMDYLRRGLDSARRTGNQHAHSEMQAMLDELETMSL